MCFGSLDYLELANLIKVWWTPQLDACCPRGLERVGDGDPLPDPRQPFPASLPLRLCWFCGCATRRRYFKLCCGWPICQLTLWPSLCSATSLSTRASRAGSSSPSGRRSCWSNWAGRTPSQPCQCRTRSCGSGTCWAWPPRWWSPCMSCGQRLLGRTAGWWLPWCSCSFLDASSTPDLIAGAEIHVEDLASMSHQESLSEGEDKRISCLVDSLR